MKEEKKEGKQTEKDRVKEEKEDYGDKDKDGEEDDIYNNDDYADHDNTNAIEHKNGHENAFSVGAEPALPQSLPHSLPHGDDHLDDQRLALYCSDTTHAQAHALNRTGSRTLSTGAVYFHF